MKRVKAGQEMWEDNGYNSSIFEGVGGVEEESQAVNLGDDPLKDLFGDHSVMSEDPGIKGGNYSSALSLAKKARDLEAKIAAGAKAPAPASEKSAAIFLEKNAASSSSSEEKTLDDKLAGFALGAGNGAAAASSSASSSAAAGGASSSAAAPPAASPTGGAGSSSSSGMNSTVETNAYDLEKAQILEDLSQRMKGLPIKSLQKLRELTRGTFADVRVQQECHNAMETYPVEQRKAAIENRELSAGRNDEGRELSAGRKRGRPPSKTGSRRRVGTEEGRHREQGAVGG